MRLICDFHLHSKYSRATSRDMDIAHIAKWTKYKGIDLVGTGDFTHPFWLKEIKDNLQEDGSGLLKPKSVNPSAQGLKFILTAELSSIYTQDGRVRKVHTIIFAPDLEAVSRINDKLTGVGNLYADGRPILGLSARELARIVLEINPCCLIIPAHAWTPWFSIFGSNSGFDSIEECYGDLSKNIKAIETGLSSDPEMNWRLSALDKITLISNSDAHSPQNLGREANIFEIPEDKLTYDEIADIIRTKDPKRFLATIEFYPEEGKYHFDGHRNCQIVSNPFERKYLDDICPKCRKKLTIGVMNRVESLADRKIGFENSQFPASKHLVPLLEIIASSEGVGTNSQKVQNEYLSLVSRFESEFKILLDTEEDFLRNNFQPRIAEGIIKVRRGDISIEPGHDGVYGKIKVFPEEEKSAQSSLF